MVRFPPLAHQPRALSVFCRSLRSCSSADGALGSPRSRLTPRHARVGRMKTQYYTAASLDGFIATLDDSLEWLFPLGNIEDTSYPAFFRDVGALAMGSATYEWMLRHLVASKGPEAWPYREPTWVFSSRARSAVAGADIRFA